MASFANTHTKSFSDRIDGPIDGDVVVRVIDRTPGLDAGKTIKTDTTGTLYHDWVWQSARDVRTMLLFRDAILFRTVVCS